MKLTGMMLLLAGVASCAFAGLVSVAPEISPASGASALALVSGALLVIRGRRKR
jgi:hypothetical protein